MEAIIDTEDKDSYRFNTTQWSLLFSSDNEAPEDSSRGDLAYICHVYWRPIFAFICARGYRPMDAQDLTQDFFVMMLEGKRLEQADPERGRFRSFLLQALRHFLSDSHRKQHSRKRGGHVNFVSWDDWMAEAPSHFCLPRQSLQHWSPERVFDARWAATVVEQALGELREECEACGRRRVFDVLCGVLSADQKEISYDILAKRLRLDRMVVKRLIYEMRRRYRVMLRRQVARTVASTEEVDEEIRYLCATLAVKAH